MIRLDPPDEDGRTGGSMRIVAREGQSVTMGLFRDDGVECRFAEVHGPSIDLLADLKGVHHDLRFTIGLCVAGMGVADSIAASDSDVPPETPMLMYGAWNSAVISYARCFGTGVRLSLKAHDVPERAREFHDYVLDLRNKHIAHSVNDHEVGTVAALVDSNPDSDIPIRGIVELLSHRYDVSAEAWDGLGSLATAVLNIVNRKIEAVRIAAEQELAAIPIQKVLEAPDLEWTLGGPGSATRSRPTHAKRRRQTPE